MNEIIFRQSEDQLLDELFKRREAYRLYGLRVRPCDKCGEYDYVISDPTTRTCECEGCWTKRRYLELVDR